MPPHERLAEALMRREAGEFARLRRLLSCNGACFRRWRKRTTSTRQITAEIEGWETEVVVGVIRRWRHVAWSEAAFRNVKLSAVLHLQTRQVTTGATRDWAEAVKDAGRNRRGVKVTVPPSEQWQFRAYK